MARKLDANVVVRLQQSEKKELEEQAKRLSISVSELVRTKATQQLAEQVNAYTRLEQERFLRQLGEQLEHVVETSARNNSELFAKLHALFRAGEY